MSIALIYYYLHAFIIFSYDFFCILFLNVSIFPIQETAGIWEHLCYRYSNNTHDFLTIQVWHTLFIMIFLVGLNDPVSIMAYLRVQKYMFFGRFHRQWPLIESASFRFAEFGIKFPTRSRDRQIWRPYKLKINISTRSTTAFFRIFLLFVLFSFFYLVFLKFRAWKATSFAYKRNDFLHYWRWFLYW